MKTFKKIIAIMLILLSCNQTAIYPPQKLSIGTIEAKMNGNKWADTYKNAYQVVRGGRQALYPCIKSWLYVNFELYSSEGFLRQQLLFSKIPEQTGTYTIVHSSPRNCCESDSAYGGLFKFIDDGCVAENAYKVSVGQDNFIQIDHYNKETGELGGKFQLTLAATGRLQGSNLPDTVQLTEGRFLTKVIVGRYIR